MRSWQGRSEPEQFTPLPESVCYGRQLEDLYVWLSIIPNTLSAAKQIIIQVYYCAQ